MLSAGAASLRSGLTPIAVFRSGAGCQPTQIVEEPCCAGPVCVFTIEVLCVALKHRVTLPGERVRRRRVVLRMSSLLEDQALLVRCRPVASGRRRAAAP